MDGIILINKQKNCTSHDVVYKVKKLLKEKVGHTGTLDPNATGVLPILVGKGTKISKYLINHDKKYIATLKLGEKKDTGDVEGNTIEEKDVEEIYIQKDNILNVFKFFIGKIKQTPPIYSAIKINGKKLYEYARSGKSVEIKPREIEIYDLKLLNIDILNKEIVFEIYCSKGTYIRTLCEDIAEKLNTVGYMKDLERIEVGEFCIKDSIKIDDLIENINNNDFMEQRFIKIEDFFKRFETIEIKDLDKFLNGVKLFTNKKDGIYKIIYNNSLIGTGVVENLKLKRDIVI